MSGIEEPTAKDIADANHVAYHDMSQINLDAAPPECDLADVREVMFKEPYEPWKKSSALNVMSGVTTGWYHNRERGALKYFINEMMLGIVVVFAQIPETISFAMIAKMDPAMGLHGAWMIGLIGTIFGGRPGMICGVTGSISTITGAMIAAQAKPHLLWPIIITAGILLLLFSILNLSFIVRFISKNVMIGFCNGLAVIIAMSQLHMFTDSTGNYVTGNTAVHMSIMCICAMISFQFWPKIPVVSRFIPAALVAVAVTFGYEYLICHMIFGVETTTVGDIGSISSEFKYPRLFWSYPAENAIFEYSSSDYGQILSYGVSFFIVMCIESLMTVNVMDQKYGDTSQGDQTLFALGIANVVSGLFGGLGGNTMIGLSNLLYAGGGCGKEGPLICAVIVFLVITLIPNALNVFPTAGLAGIMFVVAGHTFSLDSIIMVICSFLPSSFIERHPTMARAIPLPDAIILLAVTLMVPIMGLDVGIITGVVISSFYFVDKVFRQISVYKHYATREGIGLVAVYDVFGPLFFSSIANMQRSFDIKGDPDIIILRMTNSNIMDYSALEAISSLRQQYEYHGKRLIVKNLKKECEDKIMKSQARIEWDKDRDHLTQEVNVPKLVTFVNEMPDLPGHHCAQSGILYQPEPTVVSLYKEHRAHYHEGRKADSFRNTSSVSMDRLELGSIPAPEEADHRISQSLPDL